MPLGSGGGSPGPGGGSSGVALEAATASTSSAIAATLHQGVKIAETSSGFFGVVAQTSLSTGITSDGSLGKFLNETPFETFTYTQQTDQCNLSADREYSNSGTYTTGCGYNVADFKAWCGSRAATCRSILVLPGENNNSGEDGSIANYIVNTLHFQPTYFAIGNEPELWTHYGEPWSSWKTTDDVAPTALAYAFDVKGAIKAVRSVDPSARFIGIESDCSCEPTWFAAVAKIDGPNLAAIAYHSYPSENDQTTVTASEFMAPLSGATNITASYASVRAAIATSCTQCATLPILVTEYNSGPGWAPSNLAGSFSDAVFLAASTVQALEENVSMFSVFHLQSDDTSYAWSLLDAQNGVSPAGELYSDLLSHLELGGVVNDRVSTSVGNVWSVMTRSGAQHTLLVVNANTQEAIDLSINSVLHPRSGTDVTAYAWSGASTGPSETTAPLASSYDIPAEGILMIAFTS